MTGLNNPRCKAITRHGPNAGQRCGNPPIPCGALCVHHGGYLPSVRANAEKEYRAILNGERGYISEWQKAELRRRWRRAELAYERRILKREKRKHPELNFEQPATSTDPETAPVEVTEPIDDVFHYDGWNG